MADGNRTGERATVKRLASRSGLSRRSVIQAGAIGAAALVIPGCGSSSSSSSGAGEGAFELGLSNAFDANTWRKQMVTAFTTAAKELEGKGYVSGFSAVNGSDNSVSPQISAINSFVLKGVKAIVVDAASGTGVNGAIDKAVGSGATVVSFDGYATSSNSTNLAFDFVEWGRKGAEWLSIHLGGQGNVLIVGGPKGLVGTELCIEAQKKVFARSPGISVVGQVYGEATRSTSQQQVAAILPSLPKIDGVAGIGGSDSFGIVQGFQAAGVADADMPPIVTGPDGDFVQWWIEMREKYGYSTYGNNSTPEIGAWATYLITHMMRGDLSTDPVDYYVPLTEFTDKNIDSYKSVTGPAIPIKKYPYEKIPSIFREVDTLPAG